MLTTDECMNLDDYIYKSSPESCYSNTSSTEYTDEDFLQQLSSDLDIPLWLNQGEDEMSLLNSIFDKSPDEIMSEITLSPPQDEKFHDIAEEFRELSPETFPNLQADVKSEPSDSCSSSDSNKSNSPIQSPTYVTDVFDMKDEFKIESMSPCPQMVLSPMHCSPVTNMFTKQVPIQPKAPYSFPLPKKNVVIIKRPEYKLNTGVHNTSAPNVVVLENISTVPITRVSPLSPVNQCAMKNLTNNMTPMILNGNKLPMSINNVDSKILKRQQRKIKNRESACLSRKKKKDYLTSLENQVKMLSKENQTLKAHNLQLRERLSKYEGTNNFSPKVSSNNIKNTVVLCMFLFSLSFNLDYFRNPVNTNSNKFGIIKTELPKVEDHHGRNLLWATDDSSENNHTNFLPFSMCPAAINQSESARLVLELERWIGRPNKPNDTTSSTAQPIKSDIKKSKTRSLRKRKQKKQDNSLVYSMYNRMSQQLPQAETNRELQVFSSTPEQMYSEFFEAINRQDDTFYVVSLSDHHMLLPALYHNKTRRPKMSLIMPSMLPSGNASNPAVVALMQIDCEVLDTRLIQIRHGLIPQHLRKQGNATDFDSRNTDGDVSKSSDTSAKYIRKKAYKPYFMKQNSVESNENFYNLH